MNGETNGTMGALMDTNVSNKQDGIPEQTKEYVENGKNWEYTNNSESHTDIASIDIEVKCDGAKVDVFKDTVNSNTDSTKVSQDKINNGDDTLQDMNKNSDEKDACKIMATNTAKCSEYTASFEKANSCAHSLEEDVTNNSDEMPQLHEKENSIDGIDSNHNSDDDSREYCDDTVEDTMSSGEEGRQLNVTDKVNNGDHKVETFKIVTTKRHHSDDENSSGNPVFEEEIKADDTVSTHSNSDEIATGPDLHDNGDLTKNHEIILLENDETDNHNETSHEIHEIGSDSSDDDDCVVTAVDKITKKIDPVVISKKQQGLKSNETKVLRCSSRTIKCKKYDNEIQPLDDGSDIEEVAMVDPLKRKSKHVGINNTNILVDMASNQFKHKTNHKKMTTVVIIDTPTACDSRLINKSTSNTLNRNIYQRITSRGTSVTPITSKSTSTQATQANLTTNASILPTLTDDMFVVETPSFIVPYLYEKPAIVPLKEFVDKWGKEMEEAKVIEEQALLNKKQVEKSKREQEKQEKKKRVEEVIDSEEKNSDEIKKKKAEKRDRRHRERVDDDVSWNGSSSDESEDDTISDDDGQTSIFKDNVDSIEEITNVADVMASPMTISDNQFDLSLGKFFMDIGLNLVQEYVQTDLLNQQNKKLQREKKAGHNTKARQVSKALLTKNLELSQKANASFTFEQKKCELCTFKTESTLVMAHHLETPHMKNNMYTCNFCPFEIRSPHDILFHMESEHAVKAKLERAPALHQCTNCPFEDNGKGKLARHVIACAKKFKPETNLAAPVEWEHPAKIKIAKFQASRPRNNTAPYQVAEFGRHHVDGANVTNVRIPIANMLPPQFSLRTPAPAPAPGALPRTPTAVPRSSSPIPLQSRPTATATGVPTHRDSPALHTYSNTNSKKQIMHNSLSITPLPRPSVPVQPQHAANAKGCVMCEICDGYIKDLEQLRNHIQWVHKVKIHPKMIYNRPPLNCQKCQFRFFTDQGLERHLLGSHGLVTSAIQEAANRQKDSGRCPVCGKIYQWKLLEHVSRDHNLVLKPAHLSYKCTVCTATFSMYRQFESHVYTAHSVVAKKVTDKKPSAATSKANDNAAKQLKISDEITVIPQTIKSSAKEK